METDLKQAYEDIAARSQKRSAIFRRIILGIILVSIILVVIQPSLFIYLLMLLLVVVLFFGVIYSISIIAVSDAEKAYTATLEKDPNAEPKLNIDNVVETYMKGLGDSE